LRYTTSQDAKQAAAASVAATQASRQLWHSQHPETVPDFRAAHAAEQVAGGTLGVEKQLLQSMSVSEHKYTLKAAGEHAGVSSTWSGQQVHVARG
jgi:hypothetical protein